jgi:hypothetical protein
VGCIGYAVQMVVGDRGCGNLAGVVGECYSLTEVVGVGWCLGVVASDPVAGPVTALVGGGCQQYIAILLASRAPC